jgi:hypothetical protein
MNPGFNPAETQTSKPHTTNACVGTEDLPYEPPAVQSADAGTGAAGVGQVEKNAPRPDIEDGGDLVSTFLSSFIGLLLWIVKSILITFPVKVVSFTLFSLISFVLLSMLWLQFVDDHGAGELGASIEFMYNRPGIV